MKLPELKIGDKIAKIPIVQGGMAIRLSTARLAAAVANQGGIGLIAASGMSNNELRYEIRMARSLTKGVIGINI
ncbi:MAG: nitronate monooxygenase, partial [Schwartzia sp.]|nr:nitronate monooxygenase [Schwartzia sp. (in: firmicutes)]